MPFETSPLAASSALLAYFAVVGLAQTGAECGTSCDSYLIELQALYGFTEDVNTPGAPITTRETNFMCKLEFDSINTCSYCTFHSLGGFTNPVATNRLFSWQATCQTYVHVSTDQAVLCWNGLPNTSQCWTVPNTTSSLTTTTSVPPSSTSTMPLTTPIPASTAALITSRTTVASASSSTGAASSLAELSMGSLSLMANVAWLIFQ